LESFEMEIECGLVALGERLKGLESHSWSLNASSFKSSINRQLTSIGPGDVFEFSFCLRWSSIVGHTGAVYYSCGVQPRATFTVSVRVWRLRSDTPRVRQFNNLTMWYSST
jgi:hypothetical protein